MNPGGIISALAVVGLIWPSPPAKAADAAEIEALIAKGNELRRARTPGPALPYFQKAYELARTPRTTGQLGLAELDAGYPVEAAEHLAAALQSTNDRSIARYRNILTNALANARSHIGELTADGGPAGAAVVVDGRSVGVLPLSPAVKLPARNAEVVVQASGYVPFKEIVPLVGGQQRALTVNLQEVGRLANIARPVVVATAPTGPAVANSTTTAPGAVLTQRASTDQQEAPGGDSDGKSDKSIVRRWWFWTGVAAIVAGGAATAYVLTRPARLECPPGTDCP